MNQNQIMFFTCLFTANLHLQQKFLNDTLEEFFFFNETPVLIHDIIWHSQYPNLRGRLAITNSADSEPAAAHYPTPI